MIYSLKGKLIYKDAACAVIECGGVGMNCLVSANTARTLPEIGEESFLHTCLNVREDALTLFGFSTKAEKNCFKQLTAISGVGPKAALAILSELAPDQLAIALASGDTKAITRAQGVGPKLAQRIIVELKDKVTKSSELFTEGFSVPSSGVLPSAGNAQEAIGALSALGYQPSEVARVVASLDGTLPVEELIRQALKKIGGRL
ncbi:MAG: Holliday junction branch migration protein RuvA [Clostridia bacterium]|nr:Holliday junction branch migration protein RuvA [Clostridia bacterium]